jgi:hypothetical protein
MNIVRGLGRGWLNDHRPRPSRSVSRAEFGDRWPLTVDSGTLRYEPGHAVVFRAPDGTDYAVNGSAHGGRYRDIGAIWADNTDPATADYIPKVDLAPLIDAGLALGSALPALSKHR